LIKSTYGQSNRKKLKNNGSKKQKNVNPFEIEEEISEILPEDTPTMRSARSNFKNPLTPDQTQNINLDDVRQLENKFYRKKPQVKMNKIENLTKSMLKKLTKPKKSNYSFVKKNNLI
jgi:hypothetical protein